MRMPSRQKLAKEMRLAKPCSCRMEQCILLNLSLNQEGIHFWNITVAITLTLEEVGTLVLARITLTFEDSQAYHSNHHLVIWIDVLKGDHAMFVDAHVTKPITARLFKYTIGFKTLK